MFTHAAYVSLRKSELTHIIKELIKQGPQHEKNIEMIFDILYKACENEFTENGPASIKEYLQERLTTVLNKK